MISGPGFSYRLNNLEEAFLGNKMFKLDKIKKSANLFQWLAFLLLLDEIKMVGKYHLMQTEDKCLQKLFNPIRWGLFPVFLAVAYKNNFAKLFF
jgi:hypothetical protein